MDVKCLFRFQFVIGDNKNTVTRTSVSNVQPQKDSVSESFMDLESNVVSYFR